MEERPCTMEDLLEASEAFLASTTREVQSIAAVEEHRAARGERTREARRAARTDRGELSRLARAPAIWCERTRPRAAPRLPDLHGSDRASISIRHADRHGIGNRPQFVKAAAVSRRLREQHEELIVHTGQHYDDELSRVFFEELERAGARPRARTPAAARNTAQTARILAALEPVLAELRPDARARLRRHQLDARGRAGRGAGRRCRAAHVEAGMRSFDRAMPEELNRVLTDHASDLLLCSTETAVRNLEREGVARRGRSSWAT